MTGLPLLMAGFDRRYQPPRSLRHAVPGNYTAWDLFALEHDELAGDWAKTTLDALVASAAAEGELALGCTDCEDIGFYGVADPDDPDMLTGLVRRVGDGSHQALQTCGTWDEWDPKEVPLEILNLDLAGDLAAAITSGACGLLRRDAWPLAFLPPTTVVAAAPLGDVLMSLIGHQPPETSESKWVNYAVVDGVDQGAVLDVVRLRAAGDRADLERWDKGSWTLDKALLTEPDLPLVELVDENQLRCVQDQCHLAMTADAMLTVSPNPRAERLRRYWTTGKGGAKIRWTAPGSGDFNRCYRHLRKYMGFRAKGYCANLHKRATGVWPGDRRNTGLRGSTSPEEALLASIRTGQWGRTKGRTIDMPPTEQLLADGEYTEIDEAFSGIAATITAGGFPIAPPDDWFENPRLSAPTPLVVQDDGRVYGHIAQFGVMHIGMAGSVPVPHSASNYAYFLTGALTAASGKQFNVGQLTLAGGHASLGSSAAEAVKHYDDTNSAVADVNAGEDRYGIWVAGSLRPDITPEKVRAFRASPISGDWRPINGRHELVAACAVNVPGFPVVRARVAGGAILALVAAGARPLAELKIAMTADAALLERVAALEARLNTELAVIGEVEAIAEPVVTTDEPASNEAPKQEPATADQAEPVAAAAVDTAPAPVETTDPPPSDDPEPDAEPAALTAEETARAEAIRAARAEVTDLKRAALRRQVHPEVQATTAALPPEFLKNKKASTVQGTDSFPIKDVASLKKAIQAFGRAKDKAAAKKHITSMAFKLKRPDLIPANWK